MVLDDHQNLKKLDTMKDLHLQQFLHKSKSPEWKMACPSNFLKAPVPTFCTVIYSLNLIKSYEHVP